MGKPPFMRLWGPEFQVGQEGVNGSPPRSFTCSKVSGSAVLGPARSRGCPRALTHTYSHPTPGLHSHARTTASGSTHAANSVVSHVTKDARAHAVRGGVLPEGELRIATVVRM